MKVAMFTDSYLPRINGVSISVKSYAEELSKLGHRILIVCCNYSEDKQKLQSSKSYLETTSDPNINIYRVASISAFISKEDKLARVTQWDNVKKQLKIFQPDIIHINSEFTIGLSGLIYGHFLSIPRIFTFHTLWEEYASNYMKYVPNPIARKLGRDIVKHYLKHSDEIIVPTERIAGVVKKYGIKREVHILPTGISDYVHETEPDKLKTFTKQLYEKYPQLKNKRILLYVGRVAIEKNLEFLINSFNEIHKTHEDTALLFVGDGPDFQHLKDIAAHNQYSDFIIFEGYVERSLLAYYYHTADIFVFPSLTETQGLVTVEAMMSGLPVVAIGEMGTLDVMQGDNGGFMVNNNLNEFTNRINQLLSDKKLYAEKQQDALNWSNKWSIKYLTPKLVSYYNKCIEKKISKKDVR